MSKVCPVSLGIVFSLLSAVFAWAGPTQVDGPFPVVRSPITNMAFTFRKKLEEPTQALDFASRPEGGVTFVDGIITLENDVMLDVPGQGPTEFPAGSKLNPLVVATDNLLLPEGLMVSASAIANGDFSVGRFAYIGVAPRFKSENLEMYASKMGHSLRVKAWVTQDILDTYEFTLLSRFKSYSDMLAKDTIHLETLRDLKKMASEATTADLKKWYTVASYYGKHLYENPDLDIYATTANEADYKRLILTLMIRTFLNDPTQTVEGGLALFNQYRKDPTFLATRHDIAAALFRNHFKSLFVEGKPLNTADGHADSLGFLTFVYPIAIDKEGPFKLPSPGLRKFPLASSIEGRWFSNRWVDEFGGFPFLQVTEDGVAFHGPITMSPDGATWFLRRDNVSHSCMRMDASDIMELRALLPKNITQLQKLNQTIPLRITEWPDVADLHNDGAHEVVDVAYYSIPTKGSAIGNPANWRPSVYNKTYWTKEFGSYVSRLPSKNTFKLTDTGAVFTGLPKYDVIDGTLQVSGYYDEAIPIETFAHQPNQIIQYREDGVVYSGADDDGADRWGSYPPGVVNKF